MTIIEPLGNANSSADIQPPLQSFSEAIANKTKSSMGISGDGKPKQKASDLTGLIKDVFKDDKMKCFIQLLAYLKNNKDKMTKDDFTVKL